MTKYRASHFSYPIQLQQIIDNSKWQNDDVHDSLKRGEAIIENNQQAEHYLKAFGGKHKKRLDIVFEELFQEDIFTDISFEIVDYACGQGLATISFLNHLEDEMFDINRVNKIKLIEPSKIALKKAEQFLQASSDIQLINKKIDDLTFEDYSTKEENIKIHLFSNILDMADKHYYNLENFTDKIIELNHGKNIFICVSPYNKVDLNSFKEHFNNKPQFRIIADIGEEYSPSPIINNTKIIYSIFECVLD